jgi:SHS2 domain-containing protein|tara:strand:- start:44 stop:475 length:432 start_codon:yes stop_codon:yes gene_type:complete
MLKYKVLDNVAIADIAFECYGKDLNELFENSAFAIFEETTDLSKVEEKETKQIKLESDKIDKLLYDFLSEILYIKDTDSFLFKNSKVKIEEKGNKFSLEANLSGESIDREKHEMRNDIKAITLHMFKVEKTKEGYKSVIVVDV